MSSSDLYPQAKDAVKAKYVQLGTASSTNPKTLIFSRSALQPGKEHTLRRRCTVAEINAGGTLLEAIPGRAYRVHDWAMIAYGGNVSGCTDVRILGTRAGSSVALAVTAIAALTQSALVRAGATNAVILADGASFTALDAGTAVTFGKTGGSAATATGVDIIVTYTLEDA